MGGGDRATRLRFLAAGLAFASQGIHLWALIGQILVSQLPGSIFFGVAVGQGFLGAGLLLGGGRRTARWGILLNVVVVFTFLLTLAVSSPWFFEPVRLPVEGLGTAATFVEVALVAALVMLHCLLPRQGQGGRGRWGRFRRGDGEKRTQGTTAR